MQERAELLGALAGERLRRGAVGTRRTFVQRSEATGVERMQRIQQSLVVAPQVLSNAWRALAARAGQQDLAAAQDEGVGGAQACGQRLALSVREGTHEDRWSHAFQCATFSTTRDDHALVGIRYEPGAGARRPDEWLTLQSGPASLACAKHAGLHALPRSAPYGGDSATDAARQLQGW